MNRRRVHQSRTYPVTWRVSSASTTQTSQSINNPFLVDEIRVIYVGTKLNAPPGGAGMTATSKMGMIRTTDLLGGSGSIIGIAKVFDISTYNAPDTYTQGLPTVAELPRYVFPPTTRRSINGSFSFTLTELDGTPFVTSGLDFNVVFLLDLIQYTEEEVVKVDDDLQTLRKSGKRRL